jgi:serine/threonine protein kinase
MPQEYIHNRKVSPKNDVFSLGVIIFHMMAGEKGYGNYWDARRRPNFSPKIQQEFIKSVRIILLLFVLRGVCALHLPCF